MKFYICPICGNLVEMIESSGRPMTCCGKEMIELVPGRTDGLKEKHVPVYKRDGNKVCIKIGSCDHPMDKDHYIEWIVIETAKGVQRRNLKPDDKPKAEFHLCDEDYIKAVYAYCNKHGLWLVIP